MKKVWTICMSLGLATGLWSSAALAAPHADNGQGHAAMSGDHAGHGNAGQNNSAHGQAVYGNAATVTNDTYGGGQGHQGYRGLEKAWVNVQGKPAQQQIQQLLQDKYQLSDLVDLLNAQTSSGTTASADSSASVDSAGTSDTGSTSDTSASGTTDSSNTAGTGTANLTLTKDQAKALALQLKAKYQADPKLEKAQAGSLSKLTDILNSTGDLTDAASVQQDVVAADDTNMNAYVKLGKLLQKLGHHGVKAYVNGHALTSDVPPVIKDGTTLVPFRAISEALKATVSWDAATQTVTVVKDGVTIKLVIGSNTAYVNGQPIQLDQPAQVTQGTTLIPARFVSESLKATVNWDGGTESVVIYDNSTTDSTQTTDTGTQTSTAGTTSNQTTTQSTTP